ncbi:MAG: hypothetical protein WCW45_05075 [Patescibacteria group bacterium]
MKKSLMGLTVLSLSLAFIPSVFAENPAVRRQLGIRPSINAERKEMRLSGTPAMRLRAVRWVTLTAMNGTALTVTTTTGKTFQLQVTANTRLYRRLGAVSALSEFQVNDWLQAVGEWTDNSQTSMSALVIRNQSIQRYRGTFTGSVVSVNSAGNSFVFQPNKRTDQQTVTITSETKVYGQNKQQVITLADMKIGDKVVVRGLWDRANNTVTETVLVKDFSVAGPTK